MPGCDEDGCTADTVASCPNCAVQLCADHGGEAHADCPSCGFAIMDEL